MICLLEMLSVFIFGCLVGSAHHKIKVTRYLSAYTKRENVQLETLREMQIINKL